MSNDNNRKINLPKKFPMEDAKVSMRWFRYCFAINALLIIVDKSESILL